MRRILKIALALFFSLVIIGGSIYLIFIYFLNQNAALVIETNVPSQVYVGERQIGKTPFEGEFGEKEINLKLVPESFEQALVPYETRIKLTPGVKTIVRREFGAEEGSSSGIEVSFEKSADNGANIAVVTEPTGAKVYVDNVFIGVAPSKSSDLIPGPHKVAVEADGHEQKSITVQAQKGYLLTVFTDLKKIIPSSEEEAINFEEQLEENENKQQVVQILDTPTGFLRVRAEPSTSANELTQVAPEDEYPLLEISEDEEWFKIEINEETEGWVSTQYAQVLESNID